MTLKSQPGTSREATTFGRIVLPTALALVAMVVAAYLAVTALRQGAQPLGCGNAGGCQDVLSSHWAWWGPIPVALFGAAVYAGACILLIMLPRSRRAIEQYRIWCLLVVLAMVILAAVTWLVIVQVVILGSVCLWCMADHALGVVLAGWLFCLAPWKREHDTGLGVGMTMVALAVAVLAVAVLFAGQYLVGVDPAGREGWAVTPSDAVGKTEVDPYAMPLPMDPVLARDTGSLNDPGQSTAGDSRPAPRKRRVHLSDGKIKITLPLPMLGSVDADHVIIELFDYACRHCRHMYHLIEGVRQRYGNDLAIVTLPVPLNPDCNRNIKQYNSGFADACKLAELALAVWLADPAAFAAMHAWLFDEKEVPSAREAKEQAEKLVGVEALSEALASDWVKAQIRVNVLLHDRTSGLDRSGGVLPKIIHKHGVATGLPATTDALAEMLAKTLGLRSKEDAGRALGL